ncbi:MAG: site-specific integrase [Sulfuriferula sp.]
MATIIKRGSYQFQATIRRKGYPCQTKTFETKRDAESWARAIESEMDSGRYVSTKEADRTTLHEALTRYAHEVSSQKRSHRTEARRIVVWQKHPLAKLPLSQIRGADIATYIRERREFVSSGTIRLDLAIISHLYTVALQDWGLESLDNPVLKIKKPAPGKARERRLEAGEEERLLIACATSKTAPWLGAAVGLAIETGMRASEILSITWPQVRLQDRAIRLEKSKNGDSRTVPLTRGAVKILEDLPRSIDKRVIAAFCDSNGLGCAFSIVRKRANIEGLRFHDLRHEAASRFARIFSAQELAKVMGWRTLQMALRYYHPRLDELLEKMG